MRLLSYRGGTGGGRPRRAGTRTIYRRKSPPSEPVGDTVATRYRVMLRKTSGVQLETSNLIGPGISFSNPTPDDHRTAFRLTAKKEAFYWPDEINFLLA
jgi:hypothetical protein